MRNFVCTVLLMCASALGACVDQPGAGGEEPSVSKAESALDSEADFCWSGEVITFCCFGECCYGMYHSDETFVEWGC